jgi:NDP-sugar pyrophosphorylase family protein
MNKFVILAAGLGTRNTAYKNLHKALLPVGNKAAISKIIDNVSDNFEIVIAVGHLSEQIKSFVNFMHSDRKITFVDVYPYEGENSGPAISLLNCKQLISEPFIFTSVDTILPDCIKHNIPEYNWVGVNKSVPSSYACIYNMTEIRRVDNIPPIYIGIAGIFNCKDFFNTLQKANSTEVTDGFSNFSLKVFNWTDIGNDESYSIASSSSLVPLKQNQTLYIQNNKVIKYFEDKNVVKKLHTRSKLFLSVSLINDHMIGYDYINGKLFTDIQDDCEKITNIVLDKITDNITNKTSDFKYQCNLMYKKKTYQRVESFLDKYKNIDLIKKVNNVNVRPIFEILDEINWDYINESSIASSSFHGDVQPENIIVDDYKITFIDCREGFAELLDIGDIYYDFGKFWHGCLVSNQIILKNQYFLKYDEKNSIIKIKLKKFLIQSMKVINDYCRIKKYDWEKIKILGALQYITIATLYDDQKYSIFLFLLGKFLLESENLLIENLVVELNL